MSRHRDQGPTWGSARTGAAGDRLPASGDTTAPGAGPAEDRNCDNGDRAILAAIERRMQEPLRDIWWRHARWFTMPGTPPEVWDDYAGKLIGVFGGESDKILYGMTEWARGRLAELN